MLIQYMSERTSLRDDSGSGLKTPNFLVFLSSKQIWRVHPLVARLRPPREPIAKISQSGCLLPVQYTHIILEV